MDRFTVTIGNPPELDPEERRARAARARELLDGAGWAFNELISEQNRQLLDSKPEETDRREDLFRVIRATADLKGLLIQIVETQVAEERAHERRNRHQQPADHD